MTEYKKQHTITKGYLQRFTHENTANTLWRYDRRDGTCIRKNIESATVRHYAYSFQDADGEWNHDVEHLLSEIESVALPLLTKLESGDNLTNDERYDLSLLVGVMIRRPAAHIDHNRSNFIKYRNDPKTLLAFFDNLVLSLQQQFASDEISRVKELIVKGHFDLSDNAAKAVQLQTWVHAWPRYAQIIARMHWQIWKADKGQYFLTSDAPAFVRRHAHDEDLGVVGIARSDLNAELTFPVSKKCLLIARHTPSSGVRKATKTRVRELNSLIVRMAHDHVFALRGTDYVKHLIFENKGFSAPLPNLDSINAKMDVKYNLPLTKS